MVPVAGAGGDFSHPLRLCSHEGRREQRTVEAGDPALLTGQVWQRPQCGAFTSRAVEPPLRGLAFIAGSGNLDSSQGGPSAISQLQALGRVGSAEQAPRCMALQAIQCLEGGL